MRKPKSLQQRLIFFLLVPLAVFMFAVGSAVLAYSTVNMFKEWREAATLKLARTTHFIDMNLGRAKRLVRMYHEAAKAPHSREVREWIVRQLEGMDGIEQVHLIGSDNGRTQEAQSLEEEHTTGDRHQHLADPGELHSELPDTNGNSDRSPIEVMSPRFGSASGHQTVTLISETRDEEHKTVGKIEVVIRFDYLKESIEDFGWRQSDKAFIVDNEGHILTCTTGNHQKVSLDNGPLELATLRAMKNRRFGTILSQGFPPDEVSGFYRLREAPWTLVMIAPGKEILAPIIRFGLVFLIIGISSIVLILVSIRVITAPSVSMIREVSKTADRVARGDYGDLPAVRSQDEVGQLVKSFNSMVLQLEERMRLKEAMHVAMEVQQSLLPRHAPKVSGLEIAGKSIYCEETGGDYYDYFQLPEMGRNTIGIAVGDVVGHGLGAALLMTTVRAILYSKASQPGGLSPMISDVNRLLCRDTQETSSFVTLFLMAVDPDERKIRWVRAGHDPALIYTPSADLFEELRGEGMALGVDEEILFPEYACSNWTTGQIMIIGTDGIWETENPQGEAFGKARLRDTIRKHGHQSANEILEAITDALTAFRQTAAQIDDATMVVVKIL